MIDPAEAANRLLPESFRQIDADGDGQLTERELTLSNARAANQLPNVALPAMDGGGAMEINTVPRFLATATPLPFGRVGHHTRRFVGHLVVDAPAISAVPPRPIPS